MYAFGDGFDLYTGGTDPIQSFWDSGGVGCTYVTGRFPGSRAIAYNGTGTYLVKSSGANDGIHHLNFDVCYTATYQTLGAKNWCFTFSDGATAQCTIALDGGNGDLTLLSGGTAGSVLATYPNAIPKINTWYPFEIEVVIHNTTGSIAVRREGATTNTFQATGLNTRGGTANNYANKLTVTWKDGFSSAVSLDDLLWRSDPSSVPWLGDIRCFTRMPASDIQNQFATSGAATMQTSTNVGSGNGGAAANVAYWSPSPGFTCPFSATVTAMRVNLVSAFTGHIKMALYAGGTAPGALLGTTDPVTNPGAGVVTLTFPTPVSVTAGAAYYAAFLADAGLSSQIRNSGFPGVQQYSVAQLYASGFPSSPTGLTNNGNNSSFHALQAVLGGSFTVVAEPQQDGLTTYVFDSTVGDADFYGVASIDVTPISTVCVTTRAFAQKSDSGARSGAVQLKSGGTTVQSTPGPLSTTFAWNYRTDFVDPATSAAWTASGVNNIQIGPILTA